jgi:hypothetical protein
MTQISYIHGLPAMEEQETRQRSGYVPPKLVLPYPTMTEGEMELFLLMDQLGIIGGFYQDQELLKEQERIKTILNNDLHAGGISISGSGPVNNLVRTVLNRARKNTRPASIYSQPRTVSISGFLDHLQTPQDYLAYGLGFGPAKYDCEKIKNSILSISEVKDQIDFEEQDAALEGKSFDRTEYENQVLFNIMAGQGSFYNLTSVREKLNDYNQCKQFNAYVPLFHKHLDTSSPHILYNWVKNINTQPGLVITKTQAHRGAIDVLTQITGVKRDLFVLWLRNGILRANIAQGLEPYHPEKMIEILQGESPGYIQKNIPTIPQNNTAVSGAFLAVLPIIIKCLAVAVGAAATIVTLLKAEDQQKLQSSFSSWGQPSFGPETMDWETGGAGNGNGSTSGGGGILPGGSNNFLPYALLGGGLYLLIK